MRSIEAVCKESYKTPRSNDQVVPVHPESLSKRGKSSEIALVKRYMASSKNIKQDKKLVKKISPITVQAEGLAEGP